MEPCGQDAYSSEAEVWKTEESCVRIVAAEETADAVICVDHCKVALGVYVQSQDIE